MIAPPAAGPHSFEEAQQWMAQEEQNKTRIDQLAKNLQAFSKSINDASGQLDQQLKAYENRWTSEFTAAFDPEFRAQLAAVAPMTAKIDKAVTELNNLVTAIDTANGHIGDVDRMRTHPDDNWFDTWMQDVAAGEGVQALDPQQALDQATGFLAPLRNQYVVTGAALQALQAEQWRGLQATDPAQTGAAPNSPGASPKNAGGAATPKGGAQTPGGGAAGSTPGGGAAGSTPGADAAGGAGSGETGSTGDAGGTGDSGAGDTGGGTGDSGAGADLPGSTGGNPTTPDPGTGQLPDLGTGRQQPTPQPKVPTVHWPDPTPVRYPQIPVPHLGNQNSPHLAGTSTPVFTPPGSTPSVHTSPVDLPTGQDFTGQGLTGQGLTGQGSTGLPSSPGPTANVLPESSSGPGTAPGTNLGAVQADSAAGGRAGFPYLPPPMGGAAGAGARGGAGVKPGAAENPAVPEVDGRARNEDPRNVGVPPELRGRSERAPARPRKRRSGKPAGAASEILDEHLWRVADGR